METQSDVRTDDTTATEVGIISFQGKDYAAGGFSVDVESGRMIAYVTGCEGRYTLATWGGQTLARLVRTDGHRRDVCRDSCYCYGGPRGFRNETGQPTALYSFRTVDPIAGYHWYGRGLGVGMVLKLRRGRKA